MVSQRTTKRKTSKVDDTKPERIDVQVTTHQKALFARAAKLSDQTLTDFIIAALNAAAARVVRDHEVMSLSAEDSAAFAAALLRPAAPGRHLRKAAVRYKKGA
jgi:uncharacterized protein (DUF1778 family)